MCLQQHVAVKCRQSSNLTACGRLFSNDEPNTEPFRESNRTAATYLHNDDINYVKKKRVRGSVTLKAAFIAADHKFLTNCPHLRYKTVGLPIAHLDFLMF
jgi:hypothetical protein